MLLFAAACLLTVQLFVPPILGLANNGDFGKVTLRYNLASPADDEFRYVTKIYRLDASAHWESGILTSAHLPIWLAVALHGLTGQSDFDIRWMGAVHGTLFLSGLALLSSGLRRLDGRRQWLLAGGLLLALCDTSRLVYLNSFYMDASAFLFLLILAGGWVQWKAEERKAMWVIFMVAGVLFILAKTQHAALGAPLAGLAFWGGPRRRWVRTVSAIVLLACVALSFLRGPEDYTSKSLFSMIFYRLVPSSSDPSATLMELGLDDTFLPYSGKHSYMAEVPIYDREFLSRFGRHTSLGRLATYYLRHPGTTLQILIENMGEAGRERPSMGNYGRDSGMPAFAESYSFTLWSSAKQWVFGRRGWLYLAASVAVAIAMVWRLRRTSHLPAAITLVVMAGIAMGIGCLADCVETPRHMFLFNVLFDGMVLALLAGRLRKTG